MTFECVRIDKLYHSASVILTTKWLKGDGAGACLGNAVRFSCHVSYSKLS